LIADAVDSARQDLQDGRKLGLDRRYEISNEFGAVLFEVPFRSVVLIED